MRNLSIRARIIILICISVLFAALVGGAFWQQMGKLKVYATLQTQEVMLAGQKEKLHVGVHGMALALAESVKAMPPDKTIWADGIRKQINAIRFETDESGYYFVYEGTAVVSVPPKPEITGKDMGESKDKNGVAYVKDLAEAAKKGGGFVSYVFDKPGKGLEPKLAYAEAIPGTPYWIGAGIYIDNINAQKSKIDEAISGMAKNAVLTIMGIVVALLVLVVLPLSVVILRSIVNPLNAATKAAQDVAAGNLNVALAVGGKDEVSRLETALNTMVATLSDNMTKIEAKTREAEAKAQAAEKATELANEAKAQAMRARAEGLLQAAGRLETVVERMSSASEEIAGQAENIGRATDVQKGRITEAATAMEESHRA